MADNFLGDVLMGVGQGLTGQPFLTNYEKLKQDAAQWRDQQAQRQADLQASQLSNSLTGAYLKQMGVDTSGVNGMGSGSIQPGSMLPQAPQQPQVPPGAMMSMAGGGYGDAAGNVLPQAPQSPQPNAMGVKMPPVGLSMDNGKMSIKPMSPYQQALLEQHQDTLENQYENRLKTMYSSRSGVLGTAANKVDQAIGLRTLVNQQYDPKTDSYNLNPQQYHELALGLANMLAPNAVASDAKMQALIANTAQGDINGFAQYMLGTPKNASSQDLIKNMLSTIDREGLQAEKNRDAHLDSLKQLAPSGLSPDRVSAINKVNFGTSYKNFLNESPDIKSQGVQTFNVRGKSYQIPSAQVAAFKKDMGLK